jgi:glycerophosphoryl diester phosphodiesterase
VEVLAAFRGADLHDAVVSSFEAPVLQHVAGLAPAWPLWLNSWDLDPATIATAAALGCRAVSVEWHAITPASIARVRAAGLDLAAWTVHRRPTFDRIGRLGVVAICVEGAALDA